MTKLLRTNFEYKRKMINITLKIRSAFGPSNIQVDYRRAHPTNSTPYKVDNVGSVYTVSYTTESKSGQIVETVRRLTKNHISCNSEICEVKCFDCPNVSICAHSYICDCPHYGHRNFCRHSHVIAMSQSVQPPNDDHQYTTTQRSRPGFSDFPPEKAQVS